MPHWRLLIQMAGDEGFEPPNAGTRTQCLTTWRIPNAPPILPQLEKKHKVWYNNRDEGGVL